MRYPIAGLIVALLALPWPAAGAQARLERLASVGPWPGVSELIGYRGRIWFVNSVKFVNHNSADLHSFDPVHGEARYEAHLFSQDAGTPVVHRGLLYWPFEDSRFSAGRGEFMVTNGSDWAWRALPDGRAFHLHVMAARGEDLYAAPSAWRAGIQHSGDGGLSWRIIYDHPTADGNVSRITSLGVLEGRLYAGLTAWARDGRKLLTLTPGGVMPVSAWRSGRSTRALCACGGWLYGVNIEQDTRAVWRSRSGVVERVAGLDGVSVRDLAEGRNALFAVSAGDGRGALWRSADGVAWERIQAFERDEPLDLALIWGRLYVGALGPDGKGALWGQRQGPVPPPDDPAPALGAFHPTLGDHPVDKEVESLRSVLGERANFKRFRPAFREALEALLARRSRHAGPALAALLELELPEGGIPLFGGAVTVARAKIARWYLLRALLQAGGGRIPPATLWAPFDQPKNRAEKYLEPTPAAAFVAGLLGQSDDATIEALIGRLSRSGDPRWLEGDLVGALSALTGRRFGYDAAAWRNWRRELGN